MLSVTLFVSGGKRLFSPLSAHASVHTLKYEKITSIPYNIYFGLFQYSRIRNKDDYFYFPRDWIIEKNRLWKSFL